MDMKARSALSSEQQPLLLTREAAAARYSVSLRQIDAWIASGFLPCVRLARRLVRIPANLADQVMLSPVEGGQKGGSEA